MPSPSADDAIASPFAAVRAAEEREQRRVEAFRQEAVKRTEEEITALAAVQAKKEEEAKEAAQAELSAFAATTTASVLEEAKKELAKEIAGLDSAYAERSGAVVTSLTEQALSASFFSAPKR